MIRQTKATRQRLAAGAGLLALVGTPFLLCQGGTQADGAETAEKFTEEPVHAPSEDGIANGGAIFAPQKGADAKGVRAIDDS
jgi:hypothetical protein